MERPPSRLFKKPEDAEEAARDWMVFLGFRDARLTQRGADGGIDVDSTEAVAQVKAEMRPTGRPVIQGLNGVAAHHKKLGLFFSLGGYTSEALHWATDADIAAFEFDYSGGVEPVNPPAKRLMVRVESVPVIAEILDLNQIADITASVLAIVHLAQSEDRSLSDAEHVRIASMNSTVEGLVQEARQRLLSRQIDDEAQRDLADQLDEVLDDLGDLNPPRARELRVSVEDHEDEEKLRWNLYEFVSAGKPLVVSGELTVGGHGKLPDLLGETVWRICFPAQSSGISVDLIIPAGLGAQLAADWKQVEHEGLPGTLQMELIVAASIDLDEMIDDLMLPFLRLLELCDYHLSDFRKTFRRSLTQDFAGPDDVPEAILRDLQSST